MRAAHRESVNVALDELEKYVQARIGGNHPAETTGKWIAAKFEHDSSRPVEGYAAPQLHTHVVFFNMTERETGEMRALQPRELYRSQQYATAIYRSELALRLGTLGYEIEQSVHGAPEIRGYSQEYLEASSPRRQQIKDHLTEGGLSGAESAQIAAHRTREAKLNITHEEMQRRHEEMAKEYGNQPERIVREAQARAYEIAARSEEQTNGTVREAVRYSVERNFEREAVSDERELMRDALKRAMGEAPFSRIQQQFDQAVEDGGLIQKESHGIGRSFTTDEMIALERDNIRLMRSTQEQYPVLASDGTRREIEHDYAHLSSSQHRAVQEVLSSRDQITALEGVAGAGKTTSLAPFVTPPNARATASRVLHLPREPRTNLGRPESSRTHYSTTLPVERRPIPEKNISTCSMNRVSPVPGRSMTSCSGSENKTACCLWVTCDSMKLSKPDALITSYRKPECEPRIWTRSSARRTRRSRKQLSSLPVAKFTSPSKTWTAKGGYNKSKTGKNDSRQSPRSMPVVPKARWWFPQTTNPAVN